MENNVQTLVLEDRSRLAVSGVRGVDGFTEERIVLSLDGGKLTVVGEKLKIRSFSEGTGAFCCEGTVTSLKFSGGKMPMIRRLFK